MNFLSLTTGILFFSHENNTNLLHCKTSKLPGTFKEVFFYKMQPHEHKDLEPDQDPKRFGNAESGSRYEYRYLGIRSRASEKTLSS